VDSSIKFNVSANTAQFQSGMRQVSTVAKGTAAGIKSAFAGVGTMLVGGAIVSGLKSLMNDFDRVGKLATRFDTSAESIQRVSVAAQVAGTDVEAVANAMTKAGIAASKAVESGGQMAELFQRAGISARDFAAANVDEKLLMIAEAYRAAGSDAIKTNAIIEIMGSRAGANLIPLISNLESLKAEMAGVAVATDETVRRIEAANDAMTRSGNTIKVYFAEALGFYTQTAERIGSLMAGVGPQTIAEMERAQELANAANRLAKENKLILDESGKPVAAPTGFFENFGQTKEFLEQRKENERRIAEEADRFKKEQKEATKATKELGQASEEVAKKMTGQREQRSKILELGLQIKEAEAAGNEALAEKLRYQEDVEQGILKYKDAEDAYGMAVREANAELAKRNELINKGQSNGLQDIVAIRQGYIEATRGSAGLSPEEEAKRQEAIKKYHNLTRQNPELLRFDVQSKLSELAKQGVTADPIKQAIASLINGPASRALQTAGMTEPERQRAEAAGRTSSPAAAAAEADKIATESTLQKVAKFLEELNTKLPQPVLV
jgi:hypothetical protein